MPLIGLEALPMGNRLIPRQKHRSGTQKTAGGMGAAEEVARPAGRFKTAKSI